MQVTQGPTLGTAETVKSRQYSQAIRFNNYGTKAGSEYIINIIIIHIVTGTQSEHTNDTEGLTSHQVMALSMKSVFTKIQLCNKENYSSVTNCFKKAA